MFLQKAVSFFKPVVAKPGIPLHASAAAALRGLPRLGV